MSDLGGGRTSNGGPVPVQNPPAPIRTPRDVMRNRREREAKRQEETRLEEQRRQQQAAEERRQSAERRAAAATGEPRYSAASSQYTPDMSQGQFPGQRLSTGGQVASGADYGVPTGRAEPVPGRVTSQAQDQPRPAQPTQANTSRRPQPVRARGQQPQQPQQPQQAQQAPQTASDTRPGASSQARSGADPAQGTRSSSFPHAFERWEQLSSHWEGLTSYWLRRLEADAEEITRTVPTATAMSRQINDLSAAGANLFHAVVELQRLRASSERKFQRWFFETRADIERNAEIRAQLEKQLQDERSERQRSVQNRADTDIEVEKARREVAEMRRELMISKEEARRAWEELGRRNQDSLELAESLKAGRMTIVSGVQVMPIFGGPTSRTASAGQRPQTRDDVQYDTPGVTTSGAAGLRSPGDEQEYYERDMGDSPTNTDPFVENRPVLHHEPGVQSLATGTYSPYQGEQGQTSYSSAHQTTAAHAPHSASATHTPHRTTQQPSASVTAAQAERFYQQAPQDTFLHSPEAATQRYRPQAAAAPIADNQTESSDWDAEGDPHRQREYEERYGLGGPAHPTALTQIPPEAPTVPATSAEAMADYGPALSPEERPQPPADYEGEGYGAGWEQLRAPHHPTRLSDVPEEDEVSSRRTGG